MLMLECTLDELDLKKDRVLALTQKGKYIYKYMWGVNTCVPFDSIQVA